MNTEKTVSTATGVSTFNPNIPLRNLLYIAKEYEKIIME